MNLWELAKNLDGILHENTNMIMIIKQAEFLFIIVKWDNMVFLIRVDLTEAACN